jgi:ABC-type transport system substrate-binding protein
MPSGDPALGMGFYFRCNSANNHWGPGTECDQKAEDLLDQLAATVDETERKAISDELQLYTMEQYGRYPLYWEQVAAAFWPNVRGYVHHPAPNSSFIKWEHMWIEPAHEGGEGFKGQTTGVPGGI